MVRSSLLEVLSQDYIRTARAKGLAPLRVTLRHALRNALIPAITIVGLQFGNLLGGTVVIETVFSRQGLGRLAYTAILAKDFPIVQGVVLVLVLVYVLLNVAVDLSYGLLDPASATNESGSRPSVRRLLKNGSALFGLAILGTIVVLALLAPGSAVSTRSNRIPGRAAARPAPTTSSGPTDLGATSGLALSPEAAFLCALASWRWRSAWPSASCPVWSPVIAAAGSMR